MGPMPYRVDGLGPLKPVGGRIPFTGTLLAGEHETRGVSTSEASNIGRQVLASAILRIRDCSHLVRKVLHHHGRFTVLFPPCAEQFCDALTARIPGLKRFDAFNRVLASESQ
jgi:hypothetical protein